MGPGISLAEKTWHYTWITIFTAVVNILLNFILIPSYGFVGAALATLISFLVYWITKLLVSLRYFYIPYPYLKLFSYYLIGFILAFSVPYLHFYHEYQVPVHIRLITFMLLVLLGISMKFVSVTFNVNR